MSYTTKDNTRQIESDAISKASLGLRFLVEAIVETSNPRTPKKSGHLRADVLKQVLGLHGEISWRKVYAAKQEYVQHRNYTTPGTGPHFAENAVRKEVNQAEIHFRRAGLI